MVDEVVDFYVKATGRDGTQKREELMNKRPGELRRSLERWQAHAKEVQRLKEKKEHAWDLYSRVPSFGRKKKEDFEKDFGHKVVYDGKVDEKRLREWTDEMQSKVQKAERELETRESIWMASEDSNSQRRRTWEKLRELGDFSSSPYLSSLQPWQHDRGEVKPSDSTWSLCSQMCTLWTCPQITFHWQHLFVQQDAEHGLHDVHSNLVPCMYIYTNHECPFLDSGSGSTFSCNSLCILHTTQFWQHGSCNAGGSRSAHHVSDSSGCRDYTDPSLCETFTAWCSRCSPPSSGFCSTSEQCALPHMCLVWAKVVDTPPVTVVLVT